MFTKRYIKYLSAFCCSMLAMFFFSQVMAITPSTQVGVKEKRAAGVTTVAISSDGKTLATGAADSQIILFDAESGKQKLSLKGHEGQAVTKVSFNPKADKLASVGRDSVLRIWDTQKGSTLR